MEISEMKILISDDSILVRKKLNDFIASLGCTEIFEATDGQEAIDIYKEKQPDLVFMDIVMPKKTGVEALIEILSYDKHAKVVIASSVGTQAHLKTAIDAGAFDFLQKPIDNSQIEKIITNIVRGGK